MGAFSFVHLTDLHLMAGGRWAYQPDGWAVDPAANLRRVIDAVNALEPRPAFAVLGGDLASPDLLDPSRPWTAEEYEPSYRELVDLLRTLPCPIHPTLGNHDNRAAFHRILDTGVADPAEPWSYAFDHGSWHFVVLDTLVPGSPRGRLRPAQLAWLQRDLHGHSERPTMVFLHHPPWPVGLAWIDAMGLENGEALIDVLRRHPGARTIVAGHVHTDTVIQREGFTVLTTPATSVQLSKVSQTPKLLAGPPGFRTFRLDGGTITTRVLTVGEGGASAL